MNYTVHIGERDHAGWLPEVAHEPTRPEACARARELLAQLPFFGAEVRYRRRLVDSFVKRRPNDPGIGLPAGRRLYFNGIRHVFSDRVRNSDAAKAPPQDRTTLPNNDGDGEEVAT